jgi:hypothetical protein
MFYKVLSRHHSLSSTNPGPNIIEISLGCSRPDMNDHRTWGKMYLEKIWGPGRGKKLSRGQAELARQPLHCKAE